MKPSSVTNIAVLSFSCTLVIFIFLQDIALTWLNDSPKFVSWGAVFIIFISAMQIYERIFGFFLWLYTTYFYKMFDKKLDLSGEWYQVFIINEIQDPQSSVRFGSCTVVSDLDHILISGENYRKDGSFSSSWQSEVTTVSGDHIVLLFVSEGVKRNITRGTMKFHLSGLPPKKLVGNFADVAPATHSGYITLFKDKKEYEDRLVSLGISLDESFKKIS